MRLIKLILTAAVGLSLTACSDKDTPLQDSLGLDNTVDTISDLNYGTSTIPFPNDLLFAPTPGGPAADGTLNIPVDDAADLSDPKVAMNGLDGFSTVAPMSTGFSGAIDAATISGTSVRVYAVTKGGGPGGPVTAAGAALTFGVDYVAQLSSLDSGNASLVIVPLKPLLPKSSYAVVITRDLKSVSGSPVGISGSYLLTRGAAEIYDTSVTPAIPPSTASEIRAAIKVGSLQPAADATDAEIAAAAVSAFTLESIRAGIVNPSEGVLVAADSTLNSADIVLHWTFTTQSTTDVLAQVRTDVRALAPPVASFSPAPVPGAATGLTASDLYLGALTVPYYLTAAASDADPTPLASFWKGPSDSLLTYLAANVSPVATSTQTIPTMVTIPKVSVCPAGMPGSGWPVMIFQHGITSNRAAILAIGDTMATIACMAVVAIDMPMHGLTGNEVNGTGALKDTVNGERTFDLDLVTQDASGNVTAAVPDGVIDTSGRHFINLSNLQNTRDNVRQAVSDLFALVDAINNDALANATHVMNSNEIYFLGHSLGAMVGTTFLALEPDVQDAVLAFGGASLPKILDGSAAFGPSIAAGLAAGGAVKGTADYETFMGAAQTVVDSSDPVNHAVAAATGRGILFFEIVGGNSSPSDLVVPNTVPDGNDSSGTIAAPLAGTEPLLTLMGLTHVNAAPTPAVDLHLVTKFISGDHASILDPSGDAAVTTEMQTQAATFLFNEGDDISITNTAVLQAP